MGGPAVKRRGIEVGAVRPDDRLHLWVDAYLVEYFGISERTEERSRENRREFNAALDAVVETDSQRERGDDFNRFHAVER